nr:PREDICTED: uncharacterized protein LOC107398696 [Tribolium castaneum]|eukprot:XP_015839282.1 PREDICTED: uncharacterized protein LOC107398696 [Tribolium castaneum]
MRPLVSLLLLILAQNTLCEKLFLIKRFELCDNGVDYPCKIYSHFVTKKDNQILTANMTLAEEYGHNTNTDLQMFTFFPDSGKTIKVMAVNDTFCKLTRRYLGPFMNDLEKAAQILPGTCPIPKGRYHITNYPLNVNKMFLKNVIPYGTLKFVVTMTNSRSGKLLSCYEAEVQVS